MQPVIRAYDAQIDDVDRSDRSLVARINTSGTDRYRTVIDPRGGKLENYRKNPAVLWEHGKDPRRFTDPIGRNVWVKHNGGPRPTALLARTKFLTDDFSQQRFEWYRDGTLNAFSVNILPVAERCGPPTSEELRSSPEWGAAETIYREWDLAEYSGTTIPGNADCLVADRAAKMLDLVRRNLLWLPDDAMAVVEERARLRRVIEENGKFYIDFGDGKRHGPYGDREEAETIDEADCPDCGKPMRKGDGGCVCPKKDEPERSAPIEGRTLEDVWASVSAERTMMKQALREEVTALIDLWVYGRV